MVTTQKTLFRKVYGEQDNESIHLSKHPTGDLGKARVFHLDDGDYVMERQISIGKGGYATCYAGVGPRGQALCFKEISLKETPKDRQPRKPQDIQEIIRASQAEATYLSEISGAAKPYYFLRRNRKLYLITPLARRDIDASVHHYQEVSMQGAEDLVTKRCMDLDCASICKFLPENEFAPQRKSAAIYDMLLPAAKQLAALHKHGILHNDVRGQNFFIGTNGEVYLADFNGAMNLLEELPWSTPLNMGGAPWAFRAPELAFDTVQGRSSDKLSREAYLKADIYALALSAISAVLKAPLITLRMGGMPDESEKHIPLLEYTERLSKRHQVDEPKTDDERTNTKAWQEIHTLTQPLPRLLAAMLSVNPDDRPSAQSIVDTLSPLHNLMALPNGEPSWWSYFQASPAVSVALKHAEAQRQILIASQKIAATPLERQPLNSIIESEVAMPPELTEAEKAFSRLTRFNIHQANATTAPTLGARIGSCFHETKEIISNLSPQTKVLVGTVVFFYCLFSSSSKH